MSAATGIAAVSFPPILHIDPLQCLARGAAEDAIPGPASERLHDVEQFHCLSASVAGGGICRQPFGGGRRLAGTHRPISDFDAP